MGKLVNQLVAKASRADQVVSSTHRQLPPEGQAETAEGNLAAAYQRVRRGYAVHGECFVSQSVGKASRADQVVSSTHRQLPLRAGLRQQRATLPQPTSGCAGGMQSMGNALSAGLWGRQAELIRWCPQLTGSCRRGLG